MKQTVMCAGAGAAGEEMINFHACQPELIH
jgi:hypothetical protein